MHNTLASEIKEPITIPKPKTPERTKETPIPVPNPFTIPTPNIQPETLPPPKA